jgi:hypothetical protein
MSHELDATVGPDGSLILRNVPFSVGEQVHVVISPIETSAQARPWELLRGTLLKYDDPFEPAVPPEDWDALK